MKAVLTFDNSDRNVILRSMINYFNRDRRCPYVQSEIS